MKIVTALLKYSRFILSAFFLTIFLFFFIPQSAQALYFRPGTDPSNPNSTSPSCYQPPEEVPMDDCITYGGIQPQNQCLQVPWRFYYAARCIAAPIGLGPVCDFSYEYEYQNCDTSDRCYGSNTGASGFDSAGRVIPGICNASSYDGIDPESACVSGGWYKQCCSSGLYYPTTACSAGSCPNGQITSAGTTSCNATPPPPSTCPAGIQPGQACSSCVSQTCSNGTACGTGHQYCVYDSVNGNYCGGCVTEINTCSSSCTTTQPASCSVSWTFSDSTPPAGSNVTVTVNGTATPNWNGSSYSLDGGNWQTVSSGPPFSFIVNSGSPGTHSLRFSTSNGSTVCGSQNSQTFVTQSLNDASTCTALSFNSPNIVAGQNYTATVTMRNDGETTWSGSGSFPYRLGAQQPQDDPNWGTSSGADSGKGTRPTRVNLSSPVAPGSPTDFSFGVSAPDTAGTYRFSWQMLQEGIQWFGGMCAPNITVQAPAFDFTPSCTGTVTNPQTKTIRWDATVTPTTPPTGSYTYLWSGDASGTSQTVNQTYSTTGVKNATVTVTNSGISRTSANCSATISPPAAPAAPAVSLSATSPITSGSQTTLSWDISGNAQSCAVANSGTPAITSGSWSGTLTGTEISNGNHTRPITMTSSASAAKTFNISCTNTNGTSPTSSTPVIVNPSGLPPAPTVSTARVTNSCINPNHSGSDVDIAWTNSGVSWVNISTDASFGSYYHKSVTGFSTTAPNGFYLNPSTPPQQLTLNPGTTYYIRTWNGTQHSAVASFSLPACSGGPGPILPPGGGCGGSLSVAGHSAPATFSTSYRSTVSIAASAPTCFSVTLPDGNTQTTCSGSFNRNFDLSNVGPGTYDVSMTNRAWGGTCSLNVTINALQSAADCREQSSWSILGYASDDPNFDSSAWPSYSWRQNNNYQCLAGNKFKTSQTCKTNSECNDGNTCTINDTCSGYRAEYCDDERCYPERLGICTYENQVPYTVCTKDAGGNPTKLCSTNSCSGYQPASSDGETDYPEVLATCPVGGQSFCSINYVSCTDPKRNDQYCCGTTNIQGKGCQGQCNLTYYEGSPAKAGIVVHADGDQCGLNFTQITDSGGRVNFNPPRTVGSGRWGAIPSRVNYTVWAEVPSGQPFTRGTCSNTSSSIDPPALVTVTGNRAICGMTLSGGGFNAGRASFGFGVPAAPDPSTCSGNIILTLVPNPTLPLTTITAASSGLISCTSKPITIRTPDRNGVLTASCTSGTSGCNANLVVPLTAGTYTYAACIDKTSPPDGDCTDPGESDTTTLTVNPPGSSANSAWIQTTGGDVHSNVRIYTPGGP